jgi:hypothetical protein
MGQWVWTDDYGWYWMSSEPFGWITYHYGRWYNDDYYGWVWMPDDVWGPAWVEWRYNNDYIGWAPLPPYASFNFNFGIRFSTHWIAPDHYWNFVRYYRFGSVMHYKDIASVEHTRRLIRTTRSGPQYEVDHERIINRGVDRTIIERRGNVRISRAEVREVREQSRERMTRSGGNNRTEHIELFRPTRDEMQNSKERIEARRGERNLSIDMNKIERPQSESRAIYNRRQSNNTMRLDKQPESSQQGQSRESNPQVKEQKSRRERQEMRRELIQRHDSKQNSSPPMNRGIRQQQVERRRETSQSTHTNKPDSKRQSTRSSERRRAR